MCFNCHEIKEELLSKGIDVNKLSHFVCPETMRITLLRLSLFKMRNFQFQVLYGDIDKETFSKYVKTKYGIILPSEFDRPLVGIKVAKNDVLNERQQKQQKKSAEFYKRHHLKRDQERWFGKNQSPQ